MTLKPSSLILVHCASGAVTSSCGAFISNQPGACKALACPRWWAEMHLAQGGTSGGTPGRIPKWRCASHSFSVGKARTISHRDMGAVGVLHLLAGGDRRARRTHQ